MFTIKKYNYLLLPLTIFINLAFAWYINDYISPDSKAYFTIGEKFPKIENSLFPIFYPIILKIATLFTNNILLSYKLLNILSLAFCFVYTYKHNFFWKEIWLILTFSSFQSIYIFAWSENIILPLLIIYFHLIFLFDKDKIDLKSFLLKSSLVLILLFLTKYNSLFFAIASGIYYFSQIKHNKKYYYPIITYVILLIFSIIYFSMNYHFTGYYSGNRSALDSIKLNFYDYLNSSKDYIFPTLEPFGYSIVKSRLFVPTDFWRLHYLFSIFIFLGFIIYVAVSNFSNKIRISNFFLFLIFNSFLFLLLTLISAYLTRIDKLGPRLLLGFAFPLLLAIFEFAKVNFRRINFNILLIITICASIIHLTISLKYGFA